MSKADAIPEELWEPNWPDLIDATDAYIEFLASDDYNEDRLAKYENQVFEAAMESVYGPDVWEWVRARMMAE